MLQQLSFKRKIGLLVASAIVGVAALTCVAVLQTRSDIIDGRKTTLRTAVQSAHNIAAGYQAAAAAGTMSVDDAKKAAAEAVRLARYGGPEGKSDYFYIVATDGTAVMHPYIKAWGEHKQVTGTKNAQGVDTVKNMVDFFLLLMLAGAGDELQGIKKGIMEMTDAMVITKADGDNIDHATRAQSEYQHALHLFPSSISGWQPQVITASAFTGKGIDAVWKMITDYQNFTNTSGFLKQNRSTQQIAWFHEYFDQLLKSDFQRLQHFQSTLKNMEHDVAEQKVSAYSAAHTLLKAYYQDLKI